MHEVLVDRLGGLSLPRKSVVRLTDRHDMTLDVYVDVKQQYNNVNSLIHILIAAAVRKPGFRGISKFLVLSFILNTFDLVSKYNTRLMSL